MMDDSFEFQVGVGPEPGELGRSVVKKGVPLGKLGTPFKH